MISYRDIENLPQDHPLYVEFMRQVTLEMEMPLAIALEDEQSQAYFDRYIAGDR